MVPATILLASASPRRREMLERLGYRLDVRPADIDESWSPGESPADYVARVAGAKAEAAAEPDRWVLAADTTVTIDGEILAKAATADEARDMLRRLSGRSHQVLTAFSLRGPGGRCDEIVTTAVDMVPFEGPLLEDYLACGEWRDKAGAYAIQGIGAALVAGVRGSVTNVAGLPLAEVVAALVRLGGPAPSFPCGRPA